MSPFFSPDGEWVGFGAHRKLEKVSINGGLPVVVADIDNHSRRRRRGTAGILMAAPFDLTTGTVTCTGVPVLDGIAQSPVGAAQFSVSMSGALVFVPGVVRTPRRSLVWVDRKGSGDALAAPVPPY